MAKKVLIISTSLRGGGISAPNEAGNHKNAMQKAYELGKRL